MVYFLLSMKEIRLVWIKIIINLASQRSLLLLSVSFNARDQIGCRYGQWLIVIIPNRFFRFMIFTCGVVCFRILILVSFLIHLSQCACVYMQGNFNTGMDVSLNNFSNQPLLDKDAHLDFIIFVYKNECISYQPMVLSSNLQSLHPLDLNTQSVIPFFQIDQ